MEREIASAPLLAYGNEIALVGAVYYGSGRTRVLLFPDAPAEAVAKQPSVLSQLSPLDWHALIEQTDASNVQGLGKIILRKAERVIDSVVAWKVYRRDDFRCRYCGVYANPLTVDHVDLWEDGGPTIEANLVSACKPCNRERGSMPYEEWIASPEYHERARQGGFWASSENFALVGRLPEIRARRLERKRKR